MTLHEAIHKLLKQNGYAMTISEIASELNKNKWYQKKDSSDIDSFQIHGRTSRFSNLFKRNGSTVSLKDGQLEEQKIREQIETVSNVVKSSKRNDSDENYFLSLCDKVLGINSSRQHKFDFLRRDLNSQGKSKRLPVDSFYPKLRLVIEYRERQHSEPVKLFDKPNKLTISGVNRGEQRKRYDQRRRDVLPENGIRLIEISYSDFNYNGRKRIIRNEKKDFEIIKEVITNSDNDYVCQ